MTDAAPFITPAQTVLPDWIDYNGHMNVGYYLLAMDQALDAVFDELGAGEALVKSHRMGPMALVNQIHYLNELLEGERFDCAFQMLDYDHKRIHYIVTMRHLGKGVAAATLEALTLNVDLDQRKSVAYPQEIQDRLAEVYETHKSLPRPATAGASIGIRR